MLFVLVVGLLALCSRAETNVGFNQFQYNVSNATFYGSSVITDDGRLLVAATSESLQLMKCPTPVTCYVFSNLSAGLSQFSGSADIAGDWVVGASTTDSQYGTSAGAVFVYHCPPAGTTCQYFIKLTASDAATNNMFGGSVSVASNGLVVVGDNASGKAGNEGSINVFYCTNSTGTCPQISKQYGGFYDAALGRHVAVGSDGLVATTLTAGKLPGVRVKLYDCSTFTSCSLVQSLSAPPGFGSSVAYDALAGMLIVGYVGANSGIGAAYVYTCSSFNCTQMDILTPTDSQSQQFGSNVDVSPDGFVLVSNAMFEGIAYLFDCSSLPCSLVTKLEPILNGGMHRSVSIASSQLIAVSTVASEVTVGAHVFFACTGTCYCEPELCDVTCMPNQCYTNCSECNNGVCQPGTNICQCETGWEGSVCDGCALGYFGSTCESCEICEQHGTCMSGIFGWCTCDAGWTGNSCDQCDVGYFGANCTSCADCDHGTCIEGLVGSCACDLGWDGDYCDECATSYFGVNCAECTCQHGTCLDGIEGNGTCTCEPGWEGSACDGCAVGYFGSTCESCEICEEHGTCMSGIFGWCTCDAGWTGNSCDQCDVGYFGANCTSCADCDHGNCTEGLVGSCACDLGWDGDYCDECATSYFGVNCAECTCQHGTCLDGIEGNGTCTCDPGWDGDYCDECAVGYFGSNCEHLCLDCQHGDCVDGFNGTCTCDMGWSGAFCDDCDDSYGDSCQYPCSSCLRGTCEVGVDGKCTCENGWDGANCDICADGYRSDSGDCIADPEPQKLDLLPIILGIAIPLLCIILCLILLLLCHRRRKAKKTEGTFRLENMSDMYTNTMNSEGTSKMGFTTLLNTVREISLPAFLQLRLNEQFEVGAQLGQGGVGVVHRGKMLDPAIVNKFGVTDVAAKYLQNIPGYSEQDNLDLFHSEIAIMWSLAFNENVVQLVGYCEQPRIILMKLYAADLSGLLSSNVGLTSGQRYFMLRGIVNAILAMHNMEIVHRDLKSSNVLISQAGQDPTRENHYVCHITDFGLSTHNHDSAVFRSAVELRGFSFRYASPETFSNAYSKTSTIDVNNEKKSDVYAVGILAWEIATRQVPWADMTAGDVETAVRSGQTLALPQATQDPLLQKMFAVFSQCTQKNPSERPSIQDVHRMIVV